MKKKDGKPSFLYMFCGNGWKWNQYDGWHEDDYEKYKATFLSTYAVEVQAVVSDCYKGMNLDGHLGVLWLEVTDYPDCCRDENNGYSFGDLEDMKYGIISAEENLVKLGVPFTPDYKFHGRNKANLKRRNDATRKKLNMEHWEEEEWKKVK